LAHLSNYSIQKKSKKQLELAMAASTAASMTEGLLSSLNEEEEETTNEDDELLWTEEELMSEMRIGKSRWDLSVKPALRQVATHIASAVLPQWSDASVGGRAQCFELLGMCYIRIC
jgi:hypothetical protein